MLCRVDKYPSTQDCDWLRRNRQSFSESALYRLEVTGLALIPKHNHHTSSLVCRAHAIVGQVRPGVKESG